MKASKLHSAWIIIASLSYTATTCVLAIYKKLTRQMNRDWVNQRLKHWTKQVLGILGVTCTVVNRHNTKPQPGQATIIICNHSSLYDIPLTYYAFPDMSLRMLAKKELARIPLMGSAMKSAEIPTINRQNREQAIKDLEAVKKLMESGIIMWIAAEGTRSHDGKLGTFKQGPFITAIQTNATIIPIGIRGAYDILPARTHQFTLNQHAEVHIGEAIDTSQYTLENKALLIEKAHAAMKALVGETT